MFSIPSKTPEFLLEADLGRRSKPILKYRYQGNMALVFKGDVHHSTACFGDLGQPRVMLIIAVGATDLKKNNAWDQVERQLWSPFLKEKLTTKKQYQKWKDLTKYQRGQKSFVCSS